MSFNSKKFQYFLDAIQNEYSNCILHSGISNRVSDGTDTSVFVIMNMGDNPQYYPSIDDDFNMQKKPIESHSVLAVHIDLGGVAYFALKGYMLDGAYIEHGDGPDEETECFELKIQNFEELKETIDFFREVSINKDFKTVSNYVFEELEVTSLLDNNYVLIPAISNEFLLPSTLLDENQILEGIEDILNQNINPHQYLPGNDKSEPSLFFERVDEIRLAAQKLMQLKKKEIDKLIRNNKFKNKISHQDLFVRKNHNSQSLFSYDDFLDFDIHNNTDGSDARDVHALCLYYVLTLKPETSYIGIYDFLDKTIEGFNFMQEFVKNGKLPLSAAYLQNKFVQIQYALQDRINKMSIYAHIKSLLTRKESFILKDSLTKKTLKNLIPKN